MCILKHDALYQFIAVAYYAELRPVCVEQPYQFKAEGMHLIGRDAVVYRVN